RAYAQGARSEATRRAYRSDWVDFERWCSIRGASALPAMPETVVLYLADLAERVKVSTLQRRLTSIALAHKSSGVASPTTHEAVRSVWGGIKRARGAP